MLTGSPEHHTDAPSCDKVRNSADVVVIGAGAGGLAAAVRLAAAGMRTVVCEQDRHVGGTAHVFRRKGFVFPAGPLSFTVPDFLVAALGELGVNGSFRFERDVFQVRRDGLDVIISTPLRTVAEQLAAQFPSDTAGIHAVVGVLEDLIAAFRALQPRDFTVPGPWSTTPADAASLRPSGDAGTGSAVALLERWGEVPAQALLDDHIRDQRVRDLLGSQGTSETSMPVVLLARMWDFMAARGIWYPVDGIGIAGEMLAARFSESGGDLRLGTEVIEILVKHGRAAGVRLRSGEEVRARLVISDADYRRTLLDLLPPAALSDSTTRVVAQQPLTASVFAVFLGVEAGGVDLGAFRGHQLLVKVEEGSAVPWPHKKPAPEDFATEELWLCWWSRHSARERLAPPGCEALVIKVMAPYAPFLRLDGGGRRRHAEEYYRVKERMADAVVATAERVVPGLAEATVVREVATPLTYRDWGHRSEGSVAGWSWRAGDVPEPWAQDLVTTPLPGLLSVGLQAYTRLFLGGLGTSLFSGGRAADLALAELVE